MNLATAADDLLTREAVAKRAKASTALVEAKSGTGSAFCVHSSGLYVTNEHVVRSNTDGVNVVIDAGLKSQKVLKAKILRRDKNLDLALLQVEGDGKHEALELGSDKDLGELTELIACGFPFGQALARSGEYPAISVNAGSVTSLRRDKDGELHRIQLDAALNPGNSGGPVLDRKGRVVGVVVSGIRGSGVNQAIPVRHVHSFLVRPEVLLTLPIIKADRRHESFEFTAKPIHVLPGGGKAMDLELVLSSGPNRERRFPMKLVDGVYSAKTIPFPAREGPPVCRMTVMYENGSVTGTTEDRNCRIGDTEVKLNQVRSLRLGTKPEARLVDGRRLEGKPAGLDPLLLEVGKQSLRLDWAGIDEVHVAAAEETTVLNCTVVAREGDREVSRSTSPLFIEGVSKPNSPADWTKEFNKAVIPDSPLAGTVLGVDFKADKVLLNHSTLRLQSGQDSITIFLPIKLGKAVYEYQAEDQPAGGRPAIHIHVSSARPSGSAVHQTGYEMRLEFGTEKDGQIPVKLHLSLPDESKSSISGSFTVKAE